MKRIICVMLTLIMLVSLIPAGAITASAADMAASPASITVLKEMLRFEAYCYQVEGTKEFRIGYGSVCKEAHKASEYKDGTWMGIGYPDDTNQRHHKINEKTADNLLAEAMKKMDKEVNNFASSNGLTLKQGQFDALSLFSYLTGTSWMKGNGNVKTAVKTGVDATVLMNSFNAVLGNPTRSKILTNMYMNGIYSNSVSENYSEVYYRANGGTMAVSDESYKLTRMADSDRYEMYFDASKSVAHPVTPTKNGYKFIGWHFEGTDHPGRYSAALNSDCKGKTLVALWQENGATVDNAITKAPDVTYSVSKSNLASDVVYKTPNVNNPWKDGNGNLVKFGYDGKTTYEGLKEFLAPDGSRWVLTHTGGDWMLLSGAPGSSSGSSSSGGGGGRIKVYVTNGYVNVRKEANIYSAKVGTLQKNDYVYISRTESRNGFLWGKAYKHHDSDTYMGWVALMYTDYNTAKNQHSSSGSSSSETPKPTNTVIGKATITYNGYVNMRDIPGTDGNIVGSLAKNEIVSIYEIKTVNGAQWGRTSGGWFCLTYANLQMISGSSDISNSGSQNYTFTANVTVDKLPVYVDSTENSNFVDADNAPKEGTTVSIITMNIRGNELWAKIGWTYTDSNNKKVTKYGWTKAGFVEKGLGSTDAEAANIKLNPVKFTVVAESVNARAEADSGSAIVCKLNKGYEFQVTKIGYVNENIWGWTGELLLNTNGKKTEGWVNLASKYAQRSDLVGKDTAPAPEAPKDKKFAKIVGANRVNVRDDHKISGNIVGQLAMGAVVEILDWDSGWYRVDADVDNNPNTKSWVYGDYVEEVTQSSDIANAPSSHGTGVVANTYGGLNVRKGPGTAYAIVGNKLLPGTQVKILETTYTGVTKWGRTELGWVCMDYITMTNETVDIPEPPKPEAPNGGTWVGSYEEVDRTTTTAVYTGKANGQVRIWANTQHHDQDDDLSHVVRTLSYGDPVTIYELIAVEERIDITEDTDVDKDDIFPDGEGENKGDEYKIVTHYWARTNDGYIINPQDNIKLDSLDEKVHTQTSLESLNIRPGSDSEPNPSGDPLGRLLKGEKANVTALAIVKDKVWGRIEFTKDDVYVDNGWIRLDYMAEGALYEEPKETVPPTTQAPVAPPANNNNSTGDTGKNNGTYRYDGKVINTAELKVRQKATTGSSEVTKLKSGQTIYIYETTISDGMAWGRCDAGWVYLYYIDLTPRDSTYVDARVVYNPATPIYSDANRTEQVGSYSSMATIDIYEIVGNMARTELGWVYTGDLL